MTYEETLDNEKVEEHPMEGFKEMANISTGGDFGDQFAQLINELTTNVIIPTDDEDELKEWAAEHAKSEDIYAKIDGGLRIAEVPNDASGPEDVEVKGIGGGGLEGNFERGEAVVYVGDDEFVSEPIEIDRDEIIVGAGETETIDTSEMANTENMILAGAGGASGSGTGGGSQNSDGGDGGSSRRVEVQVDLSKVDELSVVVADGRDGYSNGEAGESDDADGGDGGGSTALLDGDGSRLIEISGGGGGGGGGSSGGPDDGGDGGDGGGPDGGSGGWGVTGNDGHDGSAGGYRILNGDIVTHITDVSNDGHQGEGIIFT